MNLCARCGNPTVGRTCAGCTSGDYVTATDTLVARYLEAPLPPVGPEDVRARPAGGRGADARPTRAVRRRPLRRDAEEARAPIGAGPRPGDGRRGAVGRR